MTITIVPEPIEFDVRNYGAVGDGTTDDSAAFQAAIDAAHTAGGGVVRVVPTANGYALPKGAGTSLITLKDNVRLVGDSTKIVVPSVAFLGASSYVNVFATSGTTYNVLVEGFRFISTNDQTRTNGRTGSGSNVYAIHPAAVENFIVRDCYFECLEFGVKLDTASVNVRLENLRSYQTKQPVFIANVTGVTGDGFHLDLTGDTDAYDHHFYINSGVVGLDLTGMYFKGGAGYCIDAHANSGEGQLYDCKFRGIVMDTVAYGLSTGNNANDISFSDIQGKSGTASTCIWFNVQGTTPTTPACNNISFTDFVLNGGKQLISAVVAGGALTLGAVRVSGGIVYGQMNTSMVDPTNIGDLTVEGVLFTNAQPTSGNCIVSSLNGSYGRFVFRNNTLLFPNQLNTTEVFRLRATGTAIICDNTIDNYSGVSANFICDNTNAGTVLFARNAYTGFSAVLYSGDTQTTSSANSNIGATAVTAYVNIAITSNPGPQTIDIRGRSLVDIYSALATACEVQITAPDANTPLTPVVIRAGSLSTGSIRIDARDICRLHGSWYPVATNDTLTLIPVDRNNAGGTPNAWMEIARSNNSRYQQDGQLTDGTLEDVTTTPHAVAWLGRDIITIGTSTTGAKTITLAAPAAYQSGLRLTLMCYQLLGSPAGSISLADSSPCYLAGAWTPAAGGTLTLVAANGGWYEVARSVN